MHLLLLTISDVLLRFNMGQLFVHNGHLSRSDMLALYTIKQCYIYNANRSTAPNMSRGRMVPVPILLASRQNSYYIDDLIRQRINDVKINNLNSHRIT